MKSEYRLVRIPFDSIHYVEGLKDYVKFRTDSTDEPVLSLMSMKELEEALPAGRFMRVHRSFIVNLDRIRTIDRGRIFLDGASVPVGDTYREALARLTER